MLEIVLNVKLQKFEWSEVTSPWSEATSLSLCLQKYTSELTRHWHNLVLSICRRADNFS